MKHPLLLVITQGHDYSEIKIKTQMFQIVDVPSDLIKLN